MKALEVEPLKSAGGDCFDDVIVTLDGWFRKGYKLMYANALKFDFAPYAPGSTFGSRMRIGVGDSLEMLELLHGYSIRIYRNPDPDEGLALIREQLAKGNPVVLNLDTYYSPWDPNYMTLHFPTHVMLVTGLDPESGDLTVVDPFFQKRNTLLAGHLYTDGLLGFMTIEPVDGPGADRDFVTDRIRMLLREHLDSSPDGFRRFAEAFPSIRFEDEAENRSLFMAGWLFLKLNSLVTARVNYASMLNDVAERFEMPMLAVSSGEMRQISNKWSTVRAMIVKLNYLPPERMDAKMTESVCAKILSAAEAEILAAERALSAFASPVAAARTASLPNGREPATPSSAARARLIIPVDVSGFCDGIGIENDLGTADFDNDGYCYAREGLPEDGLLRVGDMTFIFPATPAGGCDNIACAGQSIPLPAGRYRGIAILASGQYGSCMDTFTVVYADGSNEPIPLGFADWWSSEPVAGEKSAWSAPLVHREKGRQANRVNLFAGEADLGRTGLTAAQLVLPVMPTLFVFAVSMWK
ncbi:hypothetical protein GE107_10080 [Cohnella sp. CFH 77786]|uniref:BtrH N-terminal domain-containing protein n=1 Tax=Cohnella sp. CFH 77786 TaxID=2662265 RepID=UPI001C60AC2E|nr:BtrH N-terminal domain-containing protein [Cohnella sp. CFH 77786]MBW5446407.1 hypothetical protein [Cohnella sp. CFH 77786]